MLEHADKCASALRARVATAWGLPPLLLYLLEPTAGRNMDGRFPIPSARAALAALRPVPSPAAADTKPGNDADQLLDGLYLGCSDAARNVEWLTASNIGCILNCAGGEVVPLPEERRAAETRVAWYREVPIEDTDRKNFKPQLLEAVDLLHEAVTSRASAPADARCVLVHCAAGVSRSATVVLAYLVKHRGLTLLQALAVGKTARPAIYPNAAFLAFLLELDAAVHGGAHSVPELALRLHESRLVAVKAVPPLSSDERAACDAFAASLAGAPAAGSMAAGGSAAGGAAAVPLAATPTQGTHSS